MPDAKLELVHSFLYDMLVVCEPGFFLCRESL